MAEYDIDPIFERGIAQALNGFGDEAVRPFDAVQITRAAAAAADSGWRSRLPRFANGWRPVLALALLAVGLIGVGIFGGFIKLTDNNINPDPSFQPFSPLPTTVLPSGSPSASASGAVPSNGSSPPPTSGGQATGSLPPTAPPTPQPTESTSPTPSPSPTSEPTASPTPTPQPSPTPTATAQPVGGVTAIAQGDTHSCALADDGRVFCWGTNDMGQLGDGSHDERFEASVPVVGIDDAVAISAGIRFSCAVRADGSVWCWGEDPNSDGDSPVPIQVVGISDATAVTAGGAFACALRQGGQVACWGENGLGQLGAGSFADQRPAVSEVVGLDDAVQISAGWNHACAVRTDHSLWCWGGNGDGASGYGQLGDGTLDNHATPVQVTGLSNVAEVAAGGWTTCAREESGETWCWGYGEEGTLGDGNQANSSIPVKPGISDARLVSVGRFIACVTRADQSVWCWGDIGWSPISRPATTPVEGDRTRPNTIAALAVDRYVALLDGSGRVWTWAGPTAQEFAVGP